MATVISRRDVLAALGSSLAALGLPRQAHAADKLRVGKAVLEVSGFIPLDIGMKYGFFAKEGLEIEEIVFAGGAKLAQGIAAGAVDIALSGGPDMAYSAKGAPEIAVGSITASPAFMGIAVGDESTARGIDDLRGKKIGVSTAGSLTSWLVDELNRVKGWTGERDQVVQVVIGGAPTAQLAAIKTRQIDATLGGMGTGFQFEDQHVGRLLLDVSEYVSELELFVIFASTAIVQQNPAAVRRFLKGWYAAVDFMKIHKAETVQMTSEVITNYSLEVSSRLYDRTMAKFSSDGKFSPKGIAKLRASFVDLKVLDNSFDMSKLYTEEFLPKT